MGVKSYDISAQHAGSGLVFANNGTKLYGFIGGTVICQYTLSIAKLNSLSKISLEY